MNSLFTLIQIQTLCTSSSPAGHGAPKAGKAQKPGRLHHPGCPQRSRNGCITFAVESVHGLPIGVIRCYNGRLSAPTRVATTHLGSGAASSEPIPWSIDRMSSQDFIPSAWLSGICELIWHKELRGSDRQTDIHRARTPLWPTTSDPTLN